MEFGQGGLGSGLRGQANHNVRDFLLSNEDAFNLFLEEARRKGVRLSLEVPRGTQTSKVSEMSFKDIQSMGPSGTQVQNPVNSVVTKAVVPFDKRATTESNLNSNEAQEEILRKLRWNAQESSTARNLTTLLDRIKEMGIDDPNSFLSLRDAAQKSGVAERTLRRYIADGQLETEKVKGPRGWEHRVYVPALFSVLQEKAGAFERARSNPLDEMGRELATLCRAIVEQQTLAERRTNRLLDEIKNQSRVMDELRNEQKETRTQMISIQEQMIKVLTVEPKKTFLQKLFSID